MSWAELTYERHLLWSWIDQVTVAPCFARRGPPWSPCLQQVYMVLLLPRNKRMAHFGMQKTSFPEGFASIFTNLKRNQKPLSLFIFLDSTRWVTVHEPLNHIHRLLLICWISFFPFFFSVSGTIYLFPNWLFATFSCGRQNMRWT